jgi:hypothetical protein
MNNTERSFYHFDRIRINSEKSIKTLKEKLPIKELEQECHFFKIRKPHATASAMGNKSSLEIGVPSRKALELLRKHDSILSPYAITYLEITKDTFRESEKEAVSEVKNKRGSLRKLWSNSYFVWDPDKRSNIDLKKGLYITPKISCGGRDVQYALYARPSKLNGKPCVHGEWRLNKPSNIKRFTGITKIRDLVLFDIKTFIEGRNKKFLRDDKQIDIMKLGKWLTDSYPRQKKFSDEKRKEIRTEAITFLSTYQIYSFAGLIQYFKAEKMKVKEKEGKEFEYLGSPFEEKIMAVKSYNKFARIDS